MIKPKISLQALGLWLALLSLLLPPAWAQTASSDGPASYDALITAIMDNPVVMRDWAQEKLEVEDEATASGIRALLAYVFARNELGETDGFESFEVRLSTAAQTAKKLGLGAEHTKLLLLSILVRPGKDEAYLKHRMEEALKDIAIWNRPRYRAELYTDFGVMFRGMDSQALVHDALMKAQKDIMDDTYADDTIQYLVRNFVGLVLAETGDKVRSMEIYNEIYAFCQRKPLRYLGGVMAYNIASMVDQLPEKKDQDHANALYEEAARLGLASKNMRLAGFAKVGQGKVKLRARDYKGAHAALDEAIVIFEEFDQGYHLGDAYRIKASVFEAQKNWPRVLELAKKADALYGSDWDADHLVMQTMMHPALANLQRFKEAYHSLLQAFQLQKKLFAKQTEEQVEKLKVELGLQVTEQKAMLLQKENEEQARSIAQARLMMVMMTAGFAGSLVMAVLVVFGLKRSRQLRESRTRNRQILESIEETVIVIGADLAIIGQEPPSLRPLFMIESSQGPLRTLPELFANRTRLTRDEIQIIMESLQACLGETELSWDMNEAHLPRALEIGEGLRYLELDWQPILGDDDRIRELMLVIKDKTKEKELERSMGAVKLQADLQMTVITEFLRGNSAFITGFVTGMTQTLRTMPVEANGDQQQSWLRQMHTCKGTARSLGLKYLASAIHDLEDKLVSSSATPVDFQSLHTTVQIYSQIASELFADTATRSSQNDLGLLRIVSDYLPDIKQRFQLQSIELAGLDILDHYRHWTHDLAKAVGDILVHSLSNSADHGFILPRQRGETINAPHFQITAETHEEGLLLVVKDNGRGLDLARIERIAAAKAFVPDEGRPLSDVLFLGGASTSEITTDTSGRGVGLAAVHEICKKRSGKVTLLPNPDGPGTMLQVMIPTADSQALSRSA